jgi:hypothetical protein
LKEFENINIMPLDEESSYVFDNNTITKSLTRKRNMSNPNLFTQSKVERTLSKQSKSLGNLIKSNSEFNYNYNSTSSSINFKNANIQNKYYIDFIRQRHNKICENHKKILDIMELNSVIRLKDKEISKPTRLSGTLKKRSISKNSGPTSIMHFKID